MQYDVSTEDSQQHKRSTLLVEREKFLVNLEALRQTSREMRAKLDQMERVFAEIGNLRAEVHALRTQINLTAERLGLQPVPDKSIYTSADHTRPS